MKLYLNKYVNLCLENAMEHFIIFSYFSYRILYDGLYG